VFFEFQVFDLRSVTDANRSSPWSHVVTL